MLELKTDDMVLRRLNEASKKRPSASEIHQQRVSFILGSVGDKDGVTRAKVENILAAHEGIEAK